LLEFLQQELGLGAFATAFTTLKGDKQCQRLPRFPFAALLHAPVTRGEIAASG
jgi:hypothetical protein